MAEQEQSVEQPGYFRCTKTASRDFVAGTVYEVHSYEDGVAWLATESQAKCLPMPTEGHAFVPHDPWAKYRASQEEALRTPTPDAVNADKALADTAKPGRKRKYVILRKAVTGEVGGPCVTDEMVQFEAAYPYIDAAKYKDGEVIAGRMRYAEPEVDKMFSAWLSARALTRPAPGKALSEAIRALPINPNDDYAEVRRDERERIIASLLERNS